MEFPKLKEAFSQGIYSIRSDLIPRPLSSSQAPDQPLLKAPSFHWSTVQHLICSVIDDMGRASAEAQGLSHVVTSSEKLRSAEEQVLYLFIRDSSVAGLLKVGRKNLFLLDASGHQNEVYPLCVLDFYVHESLQRSGYGHKLFDAMLKDMGNLEPRLLAIDRPSPKLISFFAKHHGLSSHIPQVNHYHIFRGFFTDRPPRDEERGGKRDKRPRIYMGKLQYV
eukprot:TRINITY_DN3329_c0_g1_i1.p1 TRINITY_DN3329_c0_g1~~TRINITY_DN3329_c0_g1_i1.p1  ORF type:complete len:222 (-),score=85.47 TRINITY_DN3329_c0_g1_i1:235-900(-)